MTTLLIVGNSEGQRRCDARCYNAEGVDCDCCCGGRNHGVGEARATEHTRELAQSWIDAARAEGRMIDVAILPDAIAQEELAL